MRWLDGIIDSMDMEFEQALGDSEGQGSLACCSPWGCRVQHSLVTEQQDQNIASIKKPQDLNGCINIHKENG